MENFDLVLQYFILHTDAFRKSKFNFYFYYSLFILGDNLFGREKYCIIPFLALFRGTNVP